MTPGGIFRGAGRNIAPRSTILPHDHSSLDTGGKLSPRAFAVRTMYLLVPASRFYDAIGATVCPMTYAGTFPASYQHFSMNAVSDSDISAEFAMPGDYKIGGVIEYWIAYANSSTSANTVRFGLWVEGVDDSETLTGTADNIAADTVTPLTTADMLKVQQITTWSAGSGSIGISPGAVVRVGIRRDADHAGDTNASAMNFLGLLVSYDAEG